MSKANDCNNLFNYNESNDNDETVSLAGSFISSYNNNMDNNIKDLVDIINGGGKTMKKNKNTLSQCTLTTIQESSKRNNNNDLPQMNLNILPSDSVSNISGIDNHNNNINIDDLYNNMANFDDLKNTTHHQPVSIDTNIDNSISKFSSIVQHNDNKKYSLNDNNNSTISKTSSSHSKSIFDNNASTSSPSSPSPLSNVDDAAKNIQDQNTSNSIFDNNKNSQNSENDIFTGGVDNSDFHSNLLIALFVVFSFCILGVSCVCSLISPNVVYTLSFVLLICLFVIFIDKFK